MTWIYKISIRKYFRQYNEIEDLELLKNNVLAEMDKCPLLADFQPRLRLVKNIEQFDDVMEDMYDFADKNKIWLGA